MKAKEDSSDELPDHIKKQIQKQVRPRMGKQINITLTAFQRTQVEALVKIGIASTVAGFVKEATLEKVKKHIHLLDPKLLNPTWKKELKLIKSS